MGGYWNKNGDKPWKHKKKREKPTQQERQHRNDIKNEDSKNDMLKTLHQLDLYNGPIYDIWRYTHE